MSKVTMPEPFMYGIMEPDGTPYFGELCVSGNKGDLNDEISDLNDGNDAGLYQEVALITTTKAEAYADARVREALERAESQIMKMHDQAVKARVHPDQAEDGWNDSCADRAIALGEAVLAIRALIPPLPGPVEP